MSLVSDWLRLVRRWISSEMSTAESSCTKRSSSMRVSSSAMGCSKSRKVVLLAGGGMGPILPLVGICHFQYSTGTGSRLRQRYHVATERHGRQASPDRKSVV